MDFENPLLAKKKPKKPLLEIIIKKIFCISVNILSEVQMNYISTFQKQKKIIT